MMIIRTTLAAALAAGAFLVGPAFAQSGDTGTNPNNPYANYKADLGPGAIPPTVDQTKSQARRTTTGQTARSRTTARNRASATRMTAETERYPSGAPNYYYGGGYTPSAYGYGAPATYGYGADYGYGYAPSPAYAASPRCFMRRVLVNGRYMAWQRFCE